MPWNPSSTALLGLEWFPLRRDGLRLTNTARALGIAIPSTVAESIDQVAIYVDDVVDMPLLQLQVFAAASLPQVAATATYRPNESPADTANQTGVPTNVVGSKYQNIDEAALDQTDYVQFTQPVQNPTSWDFRVASAAGIGTDLVTAVRVKAWVKVTAGSYNVDVKLRVGSTDYEIGGRTVSNADGLTLIEAVAPTNPATGVAWTNAEIQAFDATSLVRLTFFSPGAGSIIQLSQAWMEVDHITAPAASSIPFVPAPGWNTVDVDTPAAGESFTKSLGTTYVVLVRKVTADGSVTLLGLDAGAAMPNGHLSYRPLYDATNLASELGDADTTAYPAILITSGAAASVDSQPYAVLRSEPVHVGRTVEQEVTPAATLTRGWVKVLVACEAAAVDADLLVKVRRRSDGVQVGGTATIAARDLEAAPQLLQAIDVNLAATVSLTSGTQYYLELSSTAPAGAGWLVGVLDAAAAPNSGNTKGFAGATDRATVAGVESADLDLPFLIGTVPATPAGLTVSAA